MLDDFFDNYKGKIDLPTEPDLRSKVIRMAVGSLKKKPTPNGAYQVLRDVLPCESSRYLVGALTDKDSEFKAHKILLELGPSRYTLGPLVASLSDNFDASFKILMAYKDSQVMYDFLINYACGTEDYSSAKYVFMKKGVSSESVRSLVGGLAKEEKKDFCKDVLKSYGHLVVDYLPKPQRKTKQYKPLREIILSVR